MYKTKVALDVDGVLAGFAPAFVRKAKELGYDSFYDHFAEWDSWYATGDVEEAFASVWPEIEYDWEFWVNEVEPLETAYVPYQPVAYVTSRGKAPDGATEAWLEKHDFPEAPVHVVDDSREKLGIIRDIRKERGLDVFVDDKPETARMMYHAHEDDPEGTPLGLLMTSPANSPFSSEDLDIPRVMYLPEVPEATKEYSLDANYLSRFNSEIYD